MSNVPFPIVGGRVMRATRLDRCGVPVWGDRAQIATEGYVSVAQTANYDDGNEKTVTNAQGKKCVYRPANAELTNLSLAVVFCQVDPEFYTALTGFPAEYDAETGDVVGFRIDRSVRPLDVGVALEVWADAQGTAGCDEGADVPYGYFLWPFLSGGRVGDYTIEDNAVTFSVTGMVTRDGSKWGVGPYDVVTDDAGDPAPLADEVTSTQPAVVRRTTIAPPAETYGLIPLDDPDTADATTATAGVPGTFDGVRPYDLAGMTGITADPTTAWTTGQSVILGDGSEAHWTGTAWAAGAAA